MKIANVLRPLPSENIHEPDLLAADQGLKALIFDVDGTLYRQGPVWRGILYRLLRTCVTNPVQGLLALEVLYAYRRAQEVLRKLPPESCDIAVAQLLLTSRWVGERAETVSPCVARWMEQEPLPLLARSMRHGILELLHRAKRSGLQLAVFSDYPAGRKLTAMGIAGFFDVVVTAQDPQVQRFKPDPRGLEITLERLAVERDEAVYIGDRSDVDAVAASRAGIPHFILNGTQGFNELAQLLIPRV